jgi:CheY-like chemotaxis protein
MSEIKPHILIVDDESLNRDIIERYLEDEGYELSEASNGNEALNILNTSSKKIDVVLLDRMMPNISGIEVLKTMKNDSLLSNIPVILQTARSTKEDIKEGIDAGAYFYLTKPFEEHMLLSMVRSAIEERNNYLKLKKSLDVGVSSLSMMEHGRFKFRTLDEASTLSMYLAKACPKPEKIIVGLSELFLNAIEHGNLGITYDEKTILNMENRWVEEVEKRLSLFENKNKYVDVIFDRHEDEITVKITDQGVGFDWKEYMDFSPERVFDNHGRGIATSKMLSLDDITYNEAGNVVTTKISLNTNASELDECA